MHAVEETLAGEFLEEATFATGPDPEPAVGASGAAGRELRRV